MGAESVGADLTRTGAPTLGLRLTRRSLSAGLSPRPPTSWSSAPASVTLCADGRLRRSPFADSRGSTSQSRRRTPQKLYPSGEYATAPGKWTFSMMERPM